MTTPSKNRLAARALETLFERQKIFPIIVVIIGLSVVSRVPELLPTIGNGREVEPSGHGMRVVGFPPDRTVARLFFSRDSQPPRVGSHLFVEVKNVPPGRLIARLRIANLPRDVTGPHASRCFWTSRDWDFRADGYAWLASAGEWLASTPFDPAPDATRTYELHLRVDLHERAHRAELLEVEINQHFGSAGVFAPKTQARESVAAELGAPVVMEVEPWGSGQFTTAVGFRVRSPATRAIPVEVTAVVMEEARAPRRAAALQLADIARRHAYAPEWEPLRLDLHEWRGRRVRVQLLARSLDPGSVPPFTEVYWWLGQAY